MVDCSGLDTTYSQPSNFPRLAGVLVIILGITVSLGWLLDIPAFKTIMPGLVSMKPNAAAGFILAGLSLYLTATYQTNSLMLRLASLLAFLVFGLGLMTLSEDLFDWDFGIDHMLFSTRSDHSFTPHPGRMAIFASTSFFLMGAVLLLLQHKIWLITTQVLALFVTVFIALPLTGHLFGDPTFPHIGNFTVIAPHAALAFITLSLGALSLTLEYGILARLRGNLQSIVFNIALVLLLLSGVASFSNNNRSIEYGAWISHTHEVETELQGIYAEIYKILAVHRGYLLSADEKFIADMNEAHSTLLVHFDKASLLTQDNRSQQIRLQRLKSLIDSCLDLIDEHISLHRQKGLEAAEENHLRLPVDALNNQILVLLRDLTQAEQMLLIERQTKAKISNESAQVTILVFGVISLGLILLVVYRQRRQLFERRQAQEKLKLAALVYQNSSEAMMVVDENNNIVAVNQAFSELTGYEEKDVLGKNPKILSSGRQDAEFYKAMWVSITSTGRWQGELWSRRKNGETYPEWLTIDTINNPDGSVHRRVALFVDITEKKNTEQELLSHANYDQLTLLPNRRLFNDRLEQEIRKAHREQCRTALLFIDLDHFKDINDSLGHDVGDILLMETASRIKSCVRDYDTVARLSGDEFTVILPEIEDTSTAARIAQNIIDKLGQTFYLAGHEAFISASIGIGICPDDGANSVDLVKHSDQALYVAKNEGRSRFSFFTKTMQEASDARMQMAIDLRHAISKGQLEVYYQPIVELATGYTHKAEALLRWKHPIHGFVSPSKFIPVAEDTGSILNIGDWVFLQVAQLVKKLIEHRLNFQISVNKSQVQFNSDHPDHNHWIEKLNEVCIPGSAVAVEITEGLLIDSDPNINDKLLKLRDAGIQVSIDDFGTGYSSLAYLKKFDIDYLKIDQSFTRNLSSESEELAICEAIVVMAHKLGIKVIAEGIETEQQRDLLKQIGCNYGQGYLFSWPMPAPDFEKWLFKN